MRKLYTRIDKVEKCKNLKSPKNQKERIESYHNILSNIRFKVFIDDGKITLSFIDEILFKLFDLCGVENTCKIELEYIKELKKLGLIELLYKYTDLRNIEESKENICIEVNKFIKENNHIIKKKICKIINRM